MPLPGLNAAVNWVSGWSIRISSSEEQAPGRNRIPKGHPPLIKGSLGAQTPWRGFWSCPVTLFQWCHQLLT